jgi:hypothetical protein
MQKKALSLLKQLQLMLGVDRAISFIISARAVSLITSPLTIALLVSTLNDVEQGFYYSFSALTAISIFMELGLGVVVAQFASHEFGRLEWTSSGGISGERNAIDRIVGLLRKTMVWYGAISVMLVIFLIFLGIGMFAPKAASADVNYLIPWVIFILAFAVGTFLIPLLAVLEGGGRIAEVQKIRLYQTVASPLVVWSLLAANFKLYALAFEMAVNVGILLACIVAAHWKLLAQVFGAHHFERNPVSWRRDILPMQWRIAVSWICIYLSNFLMVPLVFQLRGAVEAGQLGMSLKFSGLISLFATAWIATQVPTFGRLIGTGLFGEAAQRAKLATIRAVVVAAALSIALLIALELLIMLFPQFRGRTLSLWSVAFLCGVSISGTVVAGIAAYLRAFKEEPLMPVSILVALISAGVVYVCSKWYGSEVMAAALAAINFAIVMPLHFLVLARKGKQRVTLKLSP